MPDSNLLLDYLDQQAETHRASLLKCRTEFSEPAVHDLRVATRRLLALLDIIHTVEPHPRLQKLRRTLKDQLDGLDQLRDVQVMLEGISEHLESLHQLIPFQQSLQKREKTLLKAAGKHVKAIRSGAIHRRLGRVRKSLGDIPNENLLPRLLAAVDNAFSILMQRYAQIDPLQPATIHSVRVAFKKFRYMIECVHPLLPGFSAAQFKRMQDYQTMMGSIQDARVLRARLARFTFRHPQPDFEPVNLLMEQIFNQSIAHYLKNKSRLAKFWRPDPEAEFPWARKRKEQQP